MATKRAEPKSTVPVRLGAADFRKAIDEAERAGVQKDRMVLRLTLRDEAVLKRDPKVGVDEIDFANGEMRFHGVKVAHSGLEASALRVEAD
ncbi:MAG: hypothetical protein ACHP84_11385 [Caulobacterales bacterium]